MPTAPTRLKQAVRRYWDRYSCGTELTEQPKHSRAYFEEIEAARYRAEPQIFPFAEFTRYHRKQVLEVGVGAGTDFLQWLRAGARASGVDLTSESIENVRARLALYGLKAAMLKQADCEHLPFAANRFDLVYSWGVIHHTPDTAKAFREIIRVLKPSGRAKVMIYHRHSLVVFWLWLRRGLWRGRGFDWCLANFVESPGTKAYNAADVEQMLKGQPIVDLRVSSKLTIYDRLPSAPAFIRWLTGVAAWLLGSDRVGWFLLVELTKRSS